MPGALCRRPVLVCNVAMTWTLPSERGWMSARCSRFLKGQTGLETPCNVCEYGSEANKSFTEIVLWEMAAVAKRS